MRRPLQLICTALQASVCVCVCPPAGHTGGSEWVLVALPVCVLSQKTEEGVNIATCDEYKHGLTIPKTHTRIP